MKIDETTFECDWCRNEQKHHKIKQYRKPANTHGQIVCEKCGRYISQKTRLELNGS